MMNNPHQLHEHETKTKHDAHRVAADAAKDTLQNSVQVHEKKSAQPHTTVVTFAVVCADTKPGDNISVVGSLPELGMWDADKGVKLGTREDSFPLWHGSVSLPEAAKFEFKFIKHNESSAQFEQFAGNRIAAVAHGKATTLECGTFGVPTGTDCRGHCHTGGDKH